MDYEYTENDLDALYDWVEKHKSEEFMSLKCNYQADLDSYIEDNINELTKEFEEYMENKANEYHNDEELCL